MFNPEDLIVRGITISRDSLITLDMVPKDDRDYVTYSWTFTTQPPQLEPDGSVYYENPAALP